MIIGMRLKNLAGSSAKKFFFDKPLVLTKVGEMKRRGLSYIGGWIRKTARRSLQRRKKESEPGKPPSTHSTDGYATLKNILYAYEPTTAGVVIGPVALNMVTQAEANGNFIWKGTVPELHEHGGVATIREFQYRHLNRWPSGDPNGRWFRVDMRFSRDFYRDKPTRLRRATYPKRPFMQPAFDAALTNDKLSAAWKYALRP